MVRRALQREVHRDLDTYLATVAAPVARTKTVRADAEPGEADDEGVVAARRERPEGQKTILCDALQQLGWRAPDAIALPGGNLGNTAAFGKALVELRDLGLIDRLPRLIVVQAAGAAPFARAFAADFAAGSYAPVRAETLATAIRIGDPVSYPRARRAVEQTGGLVTAVSDEAIMEAKAAIDRAGIGCEPASAATLAGLRALVVAGRLPADLSVLGILTGHLLKDSEAVAAYHGAQPPPPGANPPVTIDPTLAAVEALLDAE